MENFIFFAPKTLNEALEILKDNKEKDTHLLAGGTDLILFIMDEKVKPEVIVDLKKIKEINFIKEENGYIRIGGATTFTQIEKSELIRRKARVLSEACSLIGSVQIRNWATVAGNIATASPAADSVPALISLGAVAVLKSVRGSREFKVEDILCGINKTKIEKDEILTEIYFKTPSENTFTGFRKLGKREALAISRISAAMAIEKYPDKDMIKNASIALGAVAKNPFRATEAENILKDKKLTPELIDECVNMISKVAAVPLGNRASAPFKRESIKGISRDILDRLYKEMNVSG